MSPEDFVSKCQDRNDKTQHYEDLLREAFGVPKNDSIESVEDVLEDK